MPRRWPRPSGRAPPRTTSVSAPRRRPRPRHLWPPRKYSVMVTTPGGGGGGGKVRAARGGREDGPRDSGGRFCYGRAPKSNRLWSTAYQPLGQTPGAYEVVF